MDTLFHAPFYLNFGIKKEPIGLLPSAIYRLFTVRFQLFFGSLAPPSYLVIFKGYFKFKLVLARQSIVWYPV